jgi:hypothetical protein
MRSLLLIPASIALAAAVGAGACAATRHNPHAAAMAAASAAALVACAAALVPLLMTRGGTQLVATQAALVGSVLHLFLCAVATAAVVLGRLLPANAFLAWMVAMIWATLAALVTVYAKSIRSAPPATAAPSPTPSPKV